MEALAQAQGTLWPSQLRHCLGPDYYHPPRQAVGLGAHGKEGNNPFWETDRDICDGYVGLNL